MQEGSGFLLYIFVFQIEKMLYLCVCFVLSKWTQMNDYLEQFLLEVVKDHLQSLSDEQFLALTCNLTKLHDGLIRQVYNQACNRNFRAPIRVVADIFVCSKRNISKFLKRT